MLIIKPNAVLLLLAAGVFFSGPVSRAQGADTCSFHTLPAVQLKKNSVFLSPAGRKTLDKIIVKANRYPTCKIKVCAKGPSSEDGYQVAWDKVESVMRYLVSKGVKRERTIFNYSHCPEMNLDEVMVILTGPAEDGPSLVPPPIPCRSYHKLTPRRCKEAHS